MAMYCLNLMRIALELARNDAVYEDIASKFFEHFLHIAEAMTKIGAGLERALERRRRVLLRRAQHPRAARSRCASARWSGLIPLFAVEVLESEMFEELPGFTRTPPLVPRAPPRSRDARLALARDRRRGASPALAAARSPHEAPARAHARRNANFSRDHGVRALSRHHLEHPFVLDCDGEHHVVKYVPGDSRDRRLRRQLELARARSGCPSTT